MIMKMTLLMFRFRITYLFIFSISTILFFFTAIAEDDAVYMSQLMKALKPTPSTWSNDTHYCKWNGVVCNETTNRVNSIILPSSSLTGTLPPDLHLLTYLTHLDLHNNSLTGTLPSLSGLAFETVLLGHNNFTSIADKCFAFVNDLKTLNLSNNLNLIPWLFPSELSESSLLQILDFQATNIIGSLHSDMFDWFPNLETVDLSHNNFTGLLPKSLGRSSIKYLKLNNQGISNQFRDTIEVISSMRLLSLAWLNNNSFIGRIPDLSNCIHLFDLKLHSNYLIGMVPPSLTSLISLKTISLDDNHLQGPKPVFRMDVSATFERNYFCGGICDPELTAFLVITKAFTYRNIEGLLTGDWYRESPCKQWRLIECRKGKVISVNWHGIGLIGNISEAFGNLRELVNLSVSGNNLTGSIPHSLTILPQLQVLDVSNNNLSGEIPQFSSKVKLITTGNVLLGREIGDGAVSGGPSKKPNATPHKPIWIALAGASLFSVGVAILILVICKRKRCLDLVQKRIFKETKTVLDENVEDFIKTYKLSMPKRYTYAEVKRITNSFKDKLGQGGYGVVYKASLPDGRHVAVKLINESKGNGEEFINEVASISKTLHVNIVSLLGFCYEKNKRALIYEFMINGSLDRFIYRKGFQSAICDLDWNTLYQIAVGIARGLDYLHQGCISRILHLDIKPQNILLDGDFCPKISDFGLAKICQKKDSIVSILGARGTIGFIAPEVFSRTFGGVSHKSDVYSYGMLILEMIGGRKNYDTGGSYTTEMYFSDWIYKDLELSDENRSAISKEEKDMRRKITMVSLWCIQINPLDRPSMSKVIELLQGPLESIAYPPMPTLYSPKRASVQSSPMSSNNLLESNSTTLQEIESNEFS